MTVVTKLSNAVSELLVLAILVVLLVTKSESTVATELLPNADSLLLKLTTAVRLASTASWDCRRLDCSVVEELNAAVVLSMVDVAAIVDEAATVDEAVPMSAEAN